MHDNPKYTQSDTHLEYVNPDAPKGGTLKQSAIGTFNTLNPFSIKGQSPLNINLINDRLMRRVWDEPFTLYPLIAKHVEIPDDRSSITFHLNPNARFHDNSPITAHDVLFSYETLREKGRANMRRIYKLVENAEIIDQHTIHFKFAEGYDRETVMIIAIMPVLSKQFWENRDFDSGLTETPLSNGPYRVKTFDLGRNITYERVENYWANDLFVNVGHYNFDQVTYDYFRDDSIALEAFKKGELNLRREWDINKWQTKYTVLPPSINLKELNHQRPERAKGMIFNLRRHPFDNLKIRKALSLAFHHEWVKKNQYGPNFKRINSIFPNAALEAPDNKPPSQSYRKRLKEAGKLLDQAGWSVVNGQRINKQSGKTMNFELIVSTPQDEKIALTYQQSLKRLGITLQIRNLDSAAFQDRKTSYEYDMIAFHWQNSLSPGTEQSLYWSCEAANEPSRFNFSGICYQNLDDLTEKIANAPSYEVLTQYAHSIDQFLRDQYVFIPLFYKGADYIAHHKNITHPDKTPLYGAVIETWWTNKNQ